MAKCTFIKTELPDLLIIEPTVYGDQRGFFIETYNYKEFVKAGLDINFIQDNHSKSMKGVLRGLHFQKEHPQYKLVRVIKGAVYDVAVDLRIGSPTFGKYFGITLSAENKKQFFIPRGFAHGFLTLEHNTEFLYKVSDYWYPDDEDGIMWNDIDININWPLEEYNISLSEISLSDRDKKWGTLKEYDSPFIFEKNNQ